MMNKMLFQSSRSSLLNGDKEYIQHRCWLGLLYFAEILEKLFFASVVPWYMNSWFSPWFLWSPVWGLHVLAFLRLWPIATVSTHAVCVLLKYNLHTELNPSLVFTRNPSTKILSWVLDFIKDLEVTGKAQNTEHVAFSHLLFPLLISSCIPLPPRLLP